MTWVKSNLAANFDVKLLGKLTAFIGWNITIQDDHIKVDQRGYAKALLAQHGYEKCNAVYSPLPRNADLTVAKDYEKLLNGDEHTKYRSIVGGILYLAV